MEYEINFQFVWSHNYIFLFFLGTSTYAAITPTKTSTTKEAIERFSPDERECYTDAEFQLRYLKKKFGYRYSMKNCLYDIVLGNTLKNCSCYFPLSPVETSKVMLKN